MPNSLKDNRIFGLDILRSVAILLVLYYHSRSLLAGFFQFRLFSNFIAFSDLTGVFGVEIFFALSGFLIGRIIIKDCLSDNYKFRTVITFWIKRWCRTLPLYYILLGITFFVWKYFYNTQFDISYLFFLQNMFGIRPDFFAESWSLSIEEWSYILIPLFLFISRLLIKMNRKNLFKLLLAYLLLCLLYKIYILKALGISVYNIESLRTIVVFRLDAIIYGIIAAFIYKYTSFYSRHYKLIMIFSIIFMIFNYVVIRLSYAPFYLSKIELYNMYVNYCALSFTNISVALLVPCMMIVTFERVSLFFKKGVTFISKISYSIYLTHYSLIFVPFFKHLAPQTILKSFLYFCYYILIVIVLSAITYQVIEKTFIQLRDTLIERINRVLQKV